MQSQARTGRGTKKVLTLSGKHLHKPDARVVKEEPQKRLPQSMGGESVAEHDYRVLQKCSPSARAEEACGFMLQDGGLFLIMRKINIPKKKKILLGGGGPIKNPVPVLLRLFLKRSHDDPIGLISCLQPLVVSRNYS